jgi:hypothetical protein
LTLSFGPGAWTWTLAGLVWFFLAAAVSAPYRRRTRTLATVLRLTVGLPLYLGGLVEALRSRGGSRLEPRPGRGRPRLLWPYRGFAPFLWAFLFAQALAWAVGSVLGSGG